MTLARTIAVRIAIALAWFIATPVVMTAALLAIGWFCTTAAGLAFDAGMRETFVLIGMALGGTSGLMAGIANALAAQMEP